MVTGRFRWRYEEDYDPYKGYVQGQFRKILLDKEFIIDELEDMKEEELRQILRDRNVIHRKSKLSSLVSKILKSQ